MNRKQWEEQFEYELDAAYQNTTQKEYKDFHEFLDSMWKEFKARCDEELELNHEYKGGM